jgi:hypothetical protein
MKVRSIKLTRAQEDALRKAAAAKGVSDSYIVREALEAYLAVPAESAPKGSVADAAAQWLGVVDDTPADLSTNPKYLDGFGK